MTKTQDKETEDKNDKSKGKKTLSLGGTLSLKTGGDSGGSGPSTPASRGSRGGASNVTVEVSRRGRRSAPSTTEGTSANEADSSSDEARTLTQSEREARIKALREAENKPKKSKIQAADDAHAENAEEEAAQAEDETTLSKAELARQKELEELERIEAEERKIAEEQAAAQAAALPDPDAPSKARKHPSHHTSPRDNDDEDSMSYRDRMKKQSQKKTTRSTSIERRRGGKLTVTQVLNEDYDRNRGPSLAAQRRAREKARMANSEAEPPKKVTREVIVPETITVHELANRMAEPGAEVVKALMKMGVMATINQIIDPDTAELIIDEFGHKIKRVTDADVETGIEGDEDKEGDLLPRPPVVTIMGHVDHGKTSLLDALRQTDVVAGEAGGITQHIGAYQITLASDQKITFLDTPGHAAFTEMRARGANVTDIVIIVVAANDSIMPQTIEAINHAKAAEVPIIIAINKIDLPDADPQRVKNDLLQHEVVIEDMGGDVQCVEISAKQKINLDTLEETILLLAEMLELKANPNRNATGTVIEAKLEQGRGNVATILIERGTLNVGDVFVVGSEFGKVRAILNDHGASVDTAIPGQPVEILGLNGAPEAGDKMVAVDSESKAREVAEYRQRKKREAEALHLSKTLGTFEQRLAASKEAEKQTLAVLIKADVHGSVEAIAGSLRKIEEENEDVRITILHTGVGGITESDVTLAKASNALIVGFNVRANAQAREQAEQEGIDVRYYNVIYNVIDDAKNILSGLLAPTEREEYLGQAEIREVFRISKLGNIAGCMVTKGSVKRGSFVRLLRDDVVIHEGQLKTLKRFKDEVKEVKEGMECGMAFENYDDIKEKDVIECYEIIEEARTVE